MHVARGEIREGPSALVLELDPPDAARRRGALGVAAPQRLEPRLLVSAEDVLVVAEGDAVPDARVEVERARGLGAELGVAREDPGMALPRADRVLLESGTPRCAGGSQAMTFTVATPVSSPRWSANLHRGTHRREH